MSVSWYTTRAQAPPPATATAIAEAEAPTVATIKRIETARYFIARCNSDPCVIPSAPMNKQNDRPITRFRTCGWWKKRAIGQASAIITRLSSAPMATVVQKMVDRSASVIVRRWTSPAPNPTSWKLPTRATTINAIPARPNSDGLRRWTSTRLDTRRDPWTVMETTVFQAMPLAIDERRSVGSSRFARTAESSWVAVGWPSAVGNTDSCASRSSGLSGTALETGRDHRRTVTVPELGEPVPGSRRPVALSLICR